ncbi:UDP-glucose 4-epimerase [Quadrisphaera granulorum]|uniref:UDP-glucose 4-epimerase n=1 Tax=Quadrisphaera granulorum TaxID=317664 RepID=A0A316A6R6_9ACTN|nr:NAD(P)-dependent oxidoreductase [Quadrisphaera granulorum]PWJ53626.1 UDP-glucose 4-epimerase [Quadrisphaera granulorum]SZE96670.1 UDP-glucose 4-epimerase [Quadrisphaera granulorum]
MHIAVTGGSGKLGRVVVADLVAHGHTVLTLDQNPPPGGVGALPRGARFLKADLADHGQVLEALLGVDEHRSEHGIDALVHLGAIPAPGLATDAVTFQNNTMSTYSAFAAARAAGIHNVVWASSETVLGLPFDEAPPYVPVDEEYHPRPNSSYSLSKTLGEEMAVQFCRWDPQSKIIGLRFSNVMYADQYAEFPDYDADPLLRKWNLWGYIDARDGAQAVRKALELEATGADVFIIANADTVMQRSSAELVEEVFPGVEIRGELGEHETLLSIEKAKRVLGYAPQHSWRDTFTA